MKLYGIPNCGTVKKARAWLSARGMDVEFIDYRKHPLSEAMLQGWIRQVGWQSLLKKTGPTWNKLPQETKDAIRDESSARALMLQWPNLIKRPVLVHEGRVLAAGFDEAEYQRLKP